MSSVRPPIINSSMIWQSRYVRVRHQAGKSQRKAAWSGGGVPIANQIWAQITVIDADHFDLVGSVFSGAYTAGGAVNKTIEVVTPYGIDDIWKLQFAQSADVLYIAHPDYQQMMLSRFTGTKFEMVPYTGFDGPYLPENTTGTTMAPDNTAGIINVYASGITGINGNVGFVASDVGRWLSLKYSNKNYGIRITAVISATQVQGDVVVEPRQDLGEELGLEEVALRWLLDLFRLPSECGGAFVTGATMANFSALAAARHAVLQKAGWNVEAEGLCGAPAITVVVGAEAHPTLFKSLGLLGLGRNRVVTVPVDTQGRMRADSLPPLTAQTIICVQAGNVNTGAFDPFTEICERVHAAGGWVHVDGAFGLWAITATVTAHLTIGLANADSWATDFHKWLNVPYDSGLALVRHADSLRAAMAITAEYLPTNSPFRNPSDYTPELSRRARGAEVSASLRSLGRSGVIELVERCCRHARRFADGLRSAGYQVINEVTLNQVLVAFGDAETTHNVVTELQTEGTCWCGVTVWQGRTAMRISVSSWATTDVDVERSLDAMLRIARKHRL
jgi:glutamate/tyrosine decarboxylase-like PLP-dependent enzyme